MNRVNDIAAVEEHASRLSIRLISFNATIVSSGTSDAINRIVMWAPKAFLVDD